MDHTIILEVLAQPYKVLSEPVNTTNILTKVTLSGKPG